MSDEIELKLALSPDDGPARLLSHPLLQALASRTILLGNQYYDTPDNRLQARRVALRVRRQGDRQLQTLKSAAQSRGGLSSRGEWEWPIDDAERNAAGLDLEGLRALEHPALEDIDLETLRPVFTTDFERRLWRHRADGSDIEIALDQGTIHAGDASLPICELELELKQGSPEQLWQLAEALCRFDDLETHADTQSGELPARPANHSKASRAARLRDGWPTPGTVDIGTVDIVTVDTLINAIDNWQDSRNPEWLVSAKARATDLVTRLGSVGKSGADMDAGMEEYADAKASAERILADLDAGQVPWRSLDWMLLRRLEA